MKETPFWTFSVEDVEKRLQSNLKKGLTSEEVRRRQKEGGDNLLAESAKISALQIFFRQFSSILIWLLFLATFIAAAIGEWVDASVIFAVVLINGFLGFFQEFKAEKSLLALKRLVTPTSRVIRDGKMKVIPSKEIVVGDLLLLESGDSVPADGRIVHAAHLMASEATLTGEAFSVHKESSSLSEMEVPLAERKNMLFMGTSIAGGKAHLMVTAIGMETELGRIADLLKEKKKESTPLQIRLEKLGRIISWSCVGIFFVVFLIGLFRQISVNEMLLVSLSLLVAAIPEGLPAVVTLTLSIGVKKMAEYKALIRRLSSVETLGCTTVICTDKTGTLTQNEMVVKEIWADGLLFDVTGEGYRPEGNFELNHNQIQAENYPELLLTLKLGVLCNNAELIEENGLWKIAGDPTEGALLSAAAKLGIKKEPLNRMFPLIDELPFDSDRKKMSVLRKSQEGGFLSVKGALDIILANCSHIEKKGRMLPLGDDEKKVIWRVHEKMASSGLRVLALALKRVTHTHPITLSDENDLTFVGFVAMRDPLRPEVKEALYHSKQAGIRTIMVTGDHKETAVAVAKELGLMGKEDLAISGQELDQMDEKSFHRIIAKSSLFSRITAAHKLRIVRALKKRGEVVAMTGDGVNDAPAINEASIGVAMGISGTDVTKEASDMIILDDNFTSIVHAVKEGRRIYQNIANYICYILSTNFAEILVILTALLLNFKDPANLPFVALIPIQLLWLNLITDGLPALAIAIDPMQKKSFLQPPKKLSAPLLPKSFLPQFIIVGFLVTLFTLLTCKIGLQTSAKLAHTMTFTTIIILELTVAQLIRAEKGLSLFSNLWFLVALVSSFILQLAILYLPFLQTLFQTTALGIKEWLIIALFSIAFFIITKALFLLIRKRTSQIDS